MEAYFIIGGLVLFIAFDIWLVVMVMRRRFKFSEADKRKFKQEWEKVRASSDGRHFLMDADKLLFKAMEKRGLKGSVGEKLKSGKVLFSDLNGIWHAHKLRNKVAHELNFEVRNNELKQAEREFERAFRDLGIL